MPLRPGYAVVEAWREPVDLLERGRKAFAGHRFFEAQTVWLAESLAAGGEARGWIEGLAMIAEGMLALEERRVRSAERLLTRGLWMLSAAPDRLGEIDLVAARAAAGEEIAALRL